ncbi:CD3324 family protein [Paenibacillus graminis]|uniref:CD3324 family protein n=1 Tax=Paenibacillus graminis TaxID=189425 RepID=UPI000F99C379|nr:CD3324 family protein [Paenibacillus graminis]MEC0167544.1 CD3324 family protein [Paenibacillus graminis]
MEYVKAAEVLPERLLREIQQYIQGEFVYIPTLPSRRRKWGESSGAAQYYLERNEEIRRIFRTGASVDELSGKYGLSVDSIKKIIYSKK